MTAGFDVYGIINKPFEIEDVTVSQENFAFEYVVAGNAVDNAFSTGGVVAHHTADSSPAARCRIGSEEQAVFGKLGVEFIQELRDQLGDEMFFSFLRNYLEQGRYQLVSSADLSYLLETQYGVDFADLSQDYFWND